MRTIPAYFCLQTETEWTRSSATLRSPTLEGGMGVGVPTHFVKDCRRGNYFRSFLPYKAGQGDNKLQPDSILGWIKSSGRPIPLRVIQSSSEGSWGNA